MALYSFNASFICRSKGQSTSAFAAYMNGAKIRDDRTGKTYDFSRKKEILDLGILAPEDAPQWVRHSATLWNGVEAFEDQMAHERFRGDSKDEARNEKSLQAREAYINSAQLSQKLMAALPKEFSQDQALEVCQEFLNHFFQKRRLGVDAAIHWEEGNPHLHALITRRPFVEGRFSKCKDREVTSKPFLLALRIGWANVCNTQLEKMGSRERITEKSYADLGLQIIGTANETRFPNVHDRMVSENAAIRQENVKILIENPEELIKLVASHKTTFTREDLKREVLRRAGGDEVLVQALQARVDGVSLPSELLVSKAVNDNERVYEGLNDQTRTLYAERLKTTVETYVDFVLKEKSLVREVGENLRFEPLYTSEVYARQEASLVNSSQILAKRTSKILTPDLISQAIKKVEDEKGFAFSPEQKVAVDFVCGGGDLRCLLGRAGTGKTTLMRAVARAYKSKGYRVLGAAFQGRVADVMGDEIGIKSQTLHSYFHQWKEHAKALQRFKKNRLSQSPLKSYDKKVIQSTKGSLLTSQDVVIVDEANMIGSDLWDPFLKEATAKGAKIIALGDPAQKLSLEAGNGFRLLVDLHGCESLQEIHRQRLAWQAQATKALNAYKIEEGLRPYNDHGRIHWADTAAQALDRLAERYVQDLKLRGSSMALGYSNREVFDLNQVLAQKIRERSAFSKEEVFKIQGTSYFKGCRLLFNTNDNHGSFIKPFKKLDTSLNPFLRTSTSSAPSSNPHVLSRTLRFCGRDFLVSTSPKGVKRGIQFFQKAPTKKGVKNGTLGTLVQWKPQSQTLIVLLDDGRTVQFNVQEYPNFQLGYAMTIMKSEASTFDRVYGLASPLAGSSDGLVMMSRHRDDCHVFADRDALTDFKGLCEALSRSPFKSVLQDFVIEPENRPYAENIQNYLNLAHELGELQGSKESFKNEEDKEAFATSLRTLYETHAHMALDILNEWDKHAPFVRQAGLRKDILEVKAGLRPRLLSDREEAVQSWVCEYMEIARQTRQLWKEISETHPAFLAPHHALYGDYEALKQERGSLALSLVEIPTLSRPFFVLKKTDQEGLYETSWGESIAQEDRVGFKTACGHAQSFVAAQKLEAWHSRLPEEEQREVELLKEYIHLRNTCVGLYHTLKDQALWAVTDSKALGLDRDDLKKSSEKRDRVALKIISQAERFEGFFEPLGLSSQHLDKLLAHALCGEFREKMEDYLSETDGLLAGIRAEELLGTLEGGAQSTVFYGLLKERGITAQRLKFDGEFAHQIESGKVPSSQVSGDVYRVLEDYRQARQESSLTWRTVQGSLTSEIQALHQDQIGLLQSIESTQKSLEGLLKEWEDKIATKAANDSFEVYVSQSLDKAVAHLNPLSVHHDAYHPIVNTQNRLKALQEKLSSTSAYDRLQEEGLEPLWKAQKKKRLEKALELASKGIVLEIVQKIQPPLSKALTKDMETARIERAVETFLHTDSFYARTLAASWLAEQTVQEQTSGKRRVIGTLKNKVASFERLHCYAALWKGLERGTLESSQIQPLETQVNAFVNAKQDYSQFWEDLPVMEEEKLQDSLESERSSLQEIFKPGVLKVQMEATEDASQVTALGVVRGAQKAALALERQTEHVHKRARQKERILDKKDTEGQEALKTDLQLTLENLVKSSLEKFSLDPHQGSPIQTHLTEIQSLKDQIFAEKLESCNTSKVSSKDLKETRNRCAHTLLKNEIFSTYVQETSTFQVKRLEEFAKEHEASCEKSSSKKGKNTQKGRQVLTKMSDLEFRNFLELINQFVDMRQLAESVLGGQDIPLNTPLSNDRDLKFGQKGSISVCLQGKKPQSWYSFEEGVGGSPLKLIGHYEGGDFQQALERIQPYVKSGEASVRLQDYLGGRKSALPSPSPQRFLKDRLQKEISQEEMDKKRLQEIKALYEITEPLEDTQAETYLRDVRGISCELSKDLRYFPPEARFVYNEKTRRARNGALAAVARNDAGELRAIQLTYLDGSGQKAKSKDGHPFTKPIFGKPKGAFVRLSREEMDQKGLAHFISEGIETALSVKSTGVHGSYHASLGIHNMQSMSLFKDLILCGDWDGESSKCVERMDKIETHFLDTSRLARTIWPLQEGDQKVDFNDILLSQGHQKIWETVIAQVPDIGKAQEILYPEFRREVLGEKAKDIVDLKKMDMEKLYTQWRKDQRDLKSGLKDQEALQDFKALSYTISLKDPEQKYGSFSKSEKEDFLKQVDTYANDPQKKLEAHKDVSRVKLAKKDSSAHLTPSLQDYKGEAHGSPNPLEHMMHLFESSQEKPSFEAQNQETLQALAHTLASNPETFQALEKHPNEAFKKFVHHHSQGFEEKHSQASFFTLKSYHQCHQVLQQKGGRLVYGRSVRVGATRGHLKYQIGKFFILFAYSFCASVMESLE